MYSGKMETLWAAGLLVTGLCANIAVATPKNDEMRFIQVAATTKEERSRLADLGMSIEFTRSDSAWGFASSSVLARLRLAQIQILGNFDQEIARGGHESITDFPPEDARFHNYDELYIELKNLNQSNLSMTRLVSIGKSLEGRDLWALQINSSPEALRTGKSNKPGIIFMGNHHAREHLSLEIPLMLAQYFLSHRGDAQISRLLETRDIWIIPMVNPDGAGWDISTGRYKSWRKNRRNNGDGTFGVDLNRNYGFKWGTGGSSTDSSSDVYMGKQPFSEPETQVIKRFVEALPNTKVLLTFHTFSELILYPWGHKYAPIENTRDHSTFEKMATTMAGWNHYKPEQASGLYIASGDTTDWAYGEHGIFAFTFELSPNSIFGGGFYPGAKVIDKVFADNLKPCLFLTDLADNPYRVLNKSLDPLLPSLAADELDPATKWEQYPLQ